LTCKRSDKAGGWRHPAIITEPGMRSEPPDKSASANWYARAARTSQGLALLLNKCSRAQGAASRYGAHADRCKDAPSGCHMAVQML